MRMKTKIRTGASMFGAASCAVGILLMASRVAASGNLYVSNLGTDDVWEFGPGGNLITSTFVSGLSGPEGLDFDNSGNLYVAYGGNQGRVAEYGPSGNLINATFASGVASPYGLAFYNGNLYALSFTASTVSEFGPGGNLIKASLGPGLSQPWGMAFDQSGNLYVANTGNNTV